MRLARQLRDGIVQVRLFLPYPLHAKLYLLFREDANNPVTGFVGSSNLTFSGLAKQGELNVDVLDHDAAHKLSAWFDDRWEDRWCLDVSADLAEVNRLMRGGIADEQLCDAVKSLREEGQLTYTEEENAQREPKIVYSMGLRVDVTL